MRGALSFLAFSLMFIALPVQAQQQTESVEQPAKAASVKGADDINPAEIPSLVFTYWEHEAIKDARRSRGLQRAPTEAQLMKDLKNKKDDTRTKPPPEERDITLGGIVYVSYNDWTIWLNGKRVTPKAIPEEVIDLTVHKEYIEIKWFDDWTNQVFPIRLRPHQRFNVDTRIFLPG